jgi:hypothetical protein
MLRWPSRVRRLVWWVWPSWPTAWSQVPERLRPAAAQISRLTVAAVVAYLVANWVSPGIVDLTAPLTALLVVQASTVGTVQMGLVRVGAVLTGVLVAVGLASTIGLSWWSLSIVIAASLVLAKLLRLGEQSLEAPISAMLILAVSSPELAAEVRVVNTFLGTLVGIGFSLLLPVSIPNARARDTVRAVARSQAGLLDEMALSIASRFPHPEEVTEWMTWAEHIGHDLDAAAASVAAVEQRRKLNPRALTQAVIHPGLHQAVGRLEQALAAQRSLLTVLAAQPPPPGGQDDDHDDDQADGQDDDQGAAEMRRAFAVVLDDLAGGLRSFADLIHAEFSPNRADDIDEAYDHTMEIVRETRAVVTDLMLIDADPRQRPDLWMLQGSVLAAVDHILRQLDVQHPERPTAAWLPRLRAR